jgi:hypothetical protein
MVLVVALGFAGCSPSLPERRLDVSASIALPEDVGSKEPIRIVYLWEPGHSFEAPLAEYLVFVHILDPEGKIVLQDDHSPPVPVDQWQVGEAQRYERWIRLHRSYALDTIGVRVGLFGEAGKVAVRWGEKWDTDSPVRWLRLVDRGYRVDPQPGDGWHPLSRSRESGEVWHWTTAAATAYFENPHRDCVLHIEARSPVDRLPGPQQVRLLLAGSEIAGFLVTDDSRFTESIPITSQEWGGRDLVDLRIEVDRTFVPAEIDPDSSDDRVLGLRVYDLYVTER